MPTKEELLLRKRFVKDYNLPINIVDNPFFDYYKERYDFFPKEEWDDCINTVNNKFNGNINSWLENYSQIRDKIITTIENSEAFKSFNTCDFKQITTPIFTVGDFNIYNASNTGKVFISIDLKKANFQALHNFNDDIVLNCESYDELIELFGGDDYLKKSKYTRQVIFGKLNPKRTIQYEKYLINSIFSEENNHLFKYLHENSKLITIKSDEIIFDITNGLVDKIGRDFLEMLKDEIKTNNNLDVSVKAFALYRLVFNNYNGDTVDGYVRYFYLEDGYVTDLKQVSSIFFPQIYTHFKGLEPNDYDLYFKAENQIAKFVHPLKFIGREG